MRVKELIEELQKFDQKDLVEVSGVNAWTTDIQIINHETSGGALPLYVVRIIGFGE